MRSAYPHYSHLTSGTNTVKKGPSTLVGLVVNTPAAGTITIEDAASDTTPVVAVITLAGDETPFALGFGIQLTYGLTVKLSATMDVTVVYE